MKVNKSRIEVDFESISKFGGLSKGGVTRLAFSKEDMDARSYLKDVMEDLGLKISVDAFGNMRGRRDGIKDLAPVAIGSHLDTVPEGGNYDGIVGVIAALEVVRVLNENNIETLRPIEVVNLSAEESSRFGGATLGSKVLSGKIGLKDLNKYADKEGVSLYKALEDNGFEPDKISEAVLDKGEIYSFIEMHIEQGPVLETEKIPVGIVTSIAAPTRFRVKFKGVADHSGNTPMNIRKDALTAASELILGVERIAKDEAGPATVGTVGYVYVKPRAMNVIPGAVELGIDIRDINSDDKKIAVKKVIDLIDKIKEDRPVEVEYEILTDDEPVELSSKVIETLVETAKDRGLDYKVMHSGAGHDAMHMADIAEAGMIFVPSKNGISHNIEEFTEMDDIVIGTELLLHATIRLAQEGE